VGRATRLFGNRPFGARPPSAINGMNAGHQNCLLNTGERVGCENGGKSLHDGIVDVEGELTGNKGGGVETSILEQPGTT